MPRPTPFHERTSELCTSYNWKEWAGYYSVCAFDTCHEREYFAFRHAAGLIDVSPLFKYEVVGKDAGRFLSHVTVKDISKLKVGQVTYCCWCDDDGKLVDDGTVTRLSENHYRLTAALPTYYWLEKFRRGFDISIEDSSESLAVLSLQGPTSRAILNDATATDLSDMKFFRAGNYRVGSLDVLITRTGYTGDLGYEIWCPKHSAVELWDALIEAGEPHGILPAGLDAMDVTRIEAGFILNGVDYFSAPTCLIDARKSSPYEVGLGWTVNLNRDSFIGQAALQQEKREGSVWGLAGLILDWDEYETLFRKHGLPPEVSSHAWRTGVPVYCKDGLHIGQATSGAWSPTLKKNLALASIASEYCKPGTKVQMEVTVEYERCKVTATVNKTPFFNPERKRK